VRPRIGKLPGADVALVAGIALLALTLFVVAFLSPPQSSDSLGYHMSRVMHWIQNRSLAPYPTADTPQLFEPPFADMVRLHLFLLTGADRAGCLLQWFAAMGAIVAASLVARDLGGSRSAQLFTALFALTLPIGVTQASSGKNGWVEALWLLALAHFSGAAKPSILKSAALVGLELATKVTAWFFAFPVLLLAVFRIPVATLRRRAGEAFGGVFLLGALVTPFLARNFAVFRHPLADPAFRSGMGIVRVTPAVVLSNAIRNCAFQFGTSRPEVNDATLRVVVALHRWMGASPYDPATSAGRFGIWPPTGMEEVAGSPIHILLLILAGGALAASRRLRSPGKRTGLLGAILGGFLLYCAVTRWQPPECRLLMPLLVLAAPLVAVVATDALGRLQPLLAAGLLAAAVPYVVGTLGRPLSFRPGKGLLATSRLDLYFARVPNLRGTYEGVAQTVRSSGVRNLGVVLSGGEPEYLLWVLLRGSQPPVRIEHVAVQNSSRDLEAWPGFRDFRPDLVVYFAPTRGIPDLPEQLTIRSGAYRLVRSEEAAGFYAPARKSS
jgi:hypothetical protein